MTIDKSLAEVFEWRAKSQAACENMSTAEQMNYIHQKAQAFIQRHHLTLVTMDSRTRINRYSNLEQPGVQMSKAQLCPGKAQ